MARGSKGGSIGGLDVAGAVTASHASSALEKVLVGFQGCAWNAWTASFLHEGSATDCSKVGGANPDQQAA
jgi:hypothetical protein